MPRTRALAPALALGCLAAVALTSVPDPAHAVGGADRTSAAAARHDARANAAMYAGITGAQSVRATDTVLDRGGASHVRFERTYRGLEVVGGDLVVHQDASGDFTGVSGRRFASGLHLGTKPTVSAAAARRAALGRFGFASRTSTPTLVVLATGRREPVLAWRTEATGRRADGAPAGQYAFVGARSGRLVAHWPSVLEDTGSGTGLFSGTVALDTTASGGQFTMVDPVRGGNATHNGPATGAPVFTDADNAWGNGTESNAQTAAVDAHYGIAKTWDYYLSTFGRSGIANDGKGARSFVHDGAYVNASWSDSCFCMRYGDGDTTTYFPLVELDVAGHEMSHGVTSRTANLAYRGESGGLNEATSDIFGTAVEFYANNANDVPDYVIGEEIFRSYNPATNFIRRMDKPSLDGASQDCYNRRTKSIDVHYSSGPANHFFYLLSEGSGAKTINGIAYNSPTCNNSTVTGLGRDAAQRIWYRALTVYMTSTTTYSQARAATLSAATDLGYSTAAVAAAWSAVGVA